LAVCTALRYDNLGFVNDGVVEILEMESKASRLTDRMTMYIWTRRGTMIDDIKQRLDKLNARMAEMRGYL